MMDGWSFIYFRGLRDEMLELLYISFIIRKNIKVKMIFIYSVVLYLNSVFLDLW